ncbi:reverse transcriptase domain-containing protein [Tanacetum coccineum]
MQKWSIQLGEFGIHYRPRISVKGQVLADFIVERLEEEDLDASAKEEEPLPAQWTLFTDGSSCVDGCGAGVILTNPEGIEFTYALRFQFKATNNEAEYEALIAGLRIAEKMFWRGCQKPPGPSEVNYVLREIHEGSCSMHAGTRSVVAKALRLVITGRTMHLGRQRRTWAKSIKFLISGHGLTLPSWIKAKPGVASSNYHRKPSKKFVWDNIVCRFGLPEEIISDNGKQFRDNPLEIGCEIMRNQHHFASVKHPQMNGLVERANRSLGEGIKARLGKDNKNWLEEISHVLWAHRTMIKSNNGDTSFLLTYGTEAVIPAKIRMPTFGTAEVNVAENDEALGINLELLEEKREQAAIREAKSKRQMEKYYNTKVKNASFKPGDLVYQNNEASRVEDTGKLGPK